MRTRILRCRLFSIRILAILLLVVAFVASCYYYNATVSSETFKKSNDMVFEVDLSGRHNQHDSLHRPQDLNLEECKPLREMNADFDTVDIFPKFDFQPSWLRTKEFWDKSFEDRYEQMHNDTKRPRLKVIVVPHSHNDPGWLETFEQYYDYKTRNIINNLVQKLNQYPNMTFIWTEISFLDAWWERSHPVMQKAFKKLIKEGRLEITTGGWVMPDEACTHIYALIDQFIEGHQWIKSNLGVTPRTGWSIDPFGHGPTVPYLLDQSGIEGTIIQRIHYAWKQWLARWQIEEFYWLPGWSTKKPSMIVHNQPFDIYSIKSTCGPHPSVCLSFDFRMIPGEYTEYTAKHEDITDQNLHSKSKTLIEEYERIGSLTTHNVVLVPLGDDFRYEYGVEFDAQYKNYIKMFQYINDHKDLFNADVQFGTPLDYFRAMKERHHSIPTLKGDFFVYSDIFSEGKPAYWSGYYTTRPYLKILARQIENHLRTSEILFTLIYNNVRQSNDNRLTSTEKRLEKAYELLIGARRNLGLFQHHDAITGTSKASVMYDYGTKLFTSLYHCLRIQETALTAVMIPDSTNSQATLQSEIEWETYGKPIKKLQISFVDKKKIILFNSLAQSRTEVITIRTNTTKVRVYDTFNKEYVQYQITPNIDVRPDGKHVISDVNFDVMFIAKLPALSAVTYSLEEFTNTSAHCVIFCNNCTQSTQENEKELFVIKKMMPGDIQLENSELKLLINRNTGFLRQIYRKSIKKKNIVEMQFGAYQSAQRHSGAYLFMPDYDNPEKQVLLPYTDSNTVQDSIIIVSGPVSTEITTMYLPFLVHTIRIYNVDDPVLSQGVLIENVVDFESPPKNRETELYMRIQTDIENGDMPEFYTDQNGFQYQKRVKVDKVGIEGNYYPITTMAWLQDDTNRVTLITNHAQGASSFEPGRLEVMLDRRTLYDDFRGLGEGVVDNKPTFFQNWLLLESVSKPNRNKRHTSERFKRSNERYFNPNNINSYDGDHSYELPSQAADYLSRTLNYPVNIHILDTTEAGNVEVKSHKSFVHYFPNGVHLMMLRTVTDDNLYQFPSPTCLMVLHRPAYSCVVGRNRDQSHNFAKTNFPDVQIKNITSVSLTGLKSYKVLNTFKDIHIDAMEVKTFQLQF